MPVGHFRITNPTIALFLEDGHHVAHTVPSGTIIKVEDGTTFDGDKLLEVFGSGKKVMMFAQDLRTRSLQVVD